MKIFIVETEKSTAVVVAASAAAIKAALDAREIVHEIRAPKPGEADGVEPITVEQISA